MASLLKDTVPTNKLAKTDQADMKDNLQVVDSEAAAKQQRARSQQHPANGGLTIENGGMDLLRSSIDDEEERIADEVIDLGYNIFD